MRESSLLIFWIASLWSYSQGHPVQKTLGRRDKISPVQVPVTRLGLPRDTVKNPQTSLLPQQKLNVKGKVRDWLEDYNGLQSPTENPDVEYRYNGQQTGTKHQLLDFYDHQSQLHNLHSPVMHHQHTAHIYDPNFSAHLEYGNDEGFGGHANQEPSSKHPEAYPGEMIEDENTLSKYIAPPVFENNNQKNQIHRRHKFTHTPEEFMTEKTNTKSLIDSLNSMMTPLQDQVDHAEDYNNNKDYNNNNNNNNEASEHKEDTKGYQKSYSSRPEEGGYDKYEVDPDKGVFKTSIEENGGYRVKTYDDQEEAHNDGQQHEYHHTHSEDMDSNTFHDQSDDHDQRYSNSHYDGHKEHEQPVDHADVQSDERNGPHQIYNDEGREEPRERSNYESKVNEAENSNARPEMEHVKQFMRDRDEQQQENDLDSRMEGMRHHAEIERGGENQDRMSQVTPEQAPPRAEAMEEPPEQRMESQEPVADSRNHAVMESREEQDAHADSRMERPERPRYQEEEMRNEEANEPVEDAEREREGGGGEGEQKPIEVVQDEHGKFKPLHEDSHTKEAIKYLQQVHGESRGDYENENNFNNKEVEKKQHIYA